jgi:hypothetical protein
MWGFNDMSRGPRRAYTTIPVSKKSLEELQKLKARVGARTWDELVEKLLEALSECSRLKLVKVVCNDLRSAEAALPAWSRLLKSRLGDEELAADALAFLRPKQGMPDIYVVNPEKCEEAGLSP